MPAQVYVQPLGIVPAPPLGSSTLSFGSQGHSCTALNVIIRGKGQPQANEVVPVADLSARLTSLAPETRSAVQDRLTRLTRSPRRWAGLDLTQPQVMGVINVTPDSFSDGGDHFDSGRAVAQGMAMLEAGAAMLDVGGESTRPGAAPVPVEEELRRVLPVVRDLAAQGAKVSIDSRRARVMAEALAAGAQVVNDVTALTGDAESLAVVADAAVPVILMHMQGEPRTMQVSPQYDDAALDIYDWLDDRIAACCAAGVAAESIIVDPGIGFGKTLAHNLQILDQLALYHGLGCPVLLGASRKSFIGTLSSETEPKNRLSGSLAAALAGVARGVHILRVHDVADTVQALQGLACHIDRRAGPRLTVSTIVT